jgi:sulfonate transport system substrate-binding protein
VIAKRPEIVQLVFDALTETGHGCGATRRPLPNFLCHSRGNVPASTIEIVNKRRSYSVKPVERAGLSEQQKIADVFFEAGLIPRRISTAEAAIWTPSTNRT